MRPVLMGLTLPRCAHDAPALWKGSRGCRLSRMRPSGLTPAQPRLRRKRIGCLLVAVVVVATFVAACIALGPMGLAWRDRDRNVVLLAWDGDASGPVWNRLVVNEKIRVPLQLDGPYVRRRSGGRIEVMRTVPRVNGHVPERASIPDAPGAAFDVVVDDARRTRFRVALRAPADSPPAVYPQPPRMLLLSDLEGDFGAFAGILRSQGVVDRHLRWTFGDGHLVLAGDFVDRGENVVPLLWLVYRLEGEAVHAGGRVHYVLGNHELLLLRGRFAAAPQRMFASRDAFFGGDNRRVFAVDTVLGQWLRTRNVIERIGDTLVVHGGLSRDFLRAELGIEEANAIASRELDIDRDRLSAEAEPVIGRHGVPWLYVPAPTRSSGETQFAAHLELALHRYGARRLAVGHTTVPRVMLGEGGKLLLLDVDHIRSGPEAALYEDGRWWRVSARRGREPL